MQTRIASQRLHRHKFKINPCASRKPVGCTSPSKTFKHVSRQTNVFLRLENRHFAQYAAFYTSSRVAPQSLPHAFCAIFPKTHHIERTSTHTFYARYTPFDAKAHCRQPPPSSSHTTRRARIAARYMPLNALAAQAAQRIPRRSHKPNKSAQAQRATTNGGTGERFSQTECRSIGKQSPLARFTPKNLDKH